MDFFFLSEVLDPASTKGLSSVSIFVGIFSLDFVLHNISHVELLLAESSEDLTVELGVGVASDADHLLLACNNFDKGILKSSISSNIDSLDEAIFLLLGKLVLGLVRLVSSHISLALSGNSSSSSTRKLLSLESPLFHGSVFGVFLDSFDWCLSRYGLSH